MIIHLAKERRSPALRQRRRLLAVLNEAQRLIGLNRFAGVLQVNLVGADTMAAMNEASLGHHGPTDVLTFDLRATEQTCPDDHQPADAAKHLAATPGLTDKTGETDDGDRDDDDDDTAGEPEVAAEIYVCPDVAGTAGPAYGNTPSREMVLYAVHGMLHLANYDDLEPAAQKRMRAAEHRVMSALQVQFPLDDFLPS